MKLCPPLWLYQGCQTCVLWTKNGPTGGFKVARVMNFEILNAHTLQVCDVFLRIFWTKPLGLDSAAESVPVSTTSRILTIIKLRIHSKSSVVQQQHSVIKEGPLMATDDTGYTLSDRIIHNHFDTRADQSSDVIAPAVVLRQRRPLPVRPPLMGRSWMLQEERMEGQPEPVTESSENQGLMDRVEKRTVDSVNRSHILQLTDGSSGGF